MLTSIRTNQTQETVYNLLFKDDDVTWQSIILDLIAKEQMNPWDIDISLIAQKFLEKLNKLKAMDFRVSGKIVLAAAIMLRIKSTKFISVDVAALDQLIANSEQEDFDLFEEGQGSQMLDYSQGEEPRLYPKTPQPRKRKVSVYDLISALEKALEVEVRRKPYIETAVEVKVPEPKGNINDSMKTVYQKVSSYFAKQPKMKLTFDQLIPSEAKMDKVMTFIPLLHLDTQRKVDLIQQEHFGTIEIELVKKSTAS